MGLFTKRNKSEYYADQKVSRLRKMSKIFFIVGVAMATISIYLCQGQEVESENISTLFEPPFVFIILGIILVIVGSLIGKYAVLKATIKAFKTDDNPLSKEAESFSNEVSEKQKVFEELKNTFEETNKNKDE